MLYPFKGCNWGPLTAHHQRSDWHNDGIVYFASSQALVWFDVIHIMSFGSILLRAYFFGSSHARKKTTSITHFDHCGKKQEQQQQHVEKKKLTCMYHNPFDVRAYPELFT